jgi:hypothetical protein
VKAFAVKQGFFVPEQPGDTIQISVPEGFEPRERQTRNPVACCKVFKNP